MAATAETLVQQGPQGRNNSTKKNSNSRTDLSTIDKRNIRGRQPTAGMLESVTSGMLITVGKLSNSKYASNSRYAYK